MHFFNENKSLIGGIHRLMRLNKSTGYALQILLYLTKNRRIVSSMELTENIAVSQRYLIQIAGKLRSGELVITTIGMGGGYALFKEPALISVYDIIVLMEGGICIPQNLTTSVNNLSNLYDIFLLLTEYIETYLRSVTLDKLTDGVYSGAFWQRSDRIQASSQ